MYDGMLHPRFDRERVTFTGGPLLCEEKWAGFLGRCRL